MFVLCRSTFYLGQDKTDYTYYAPYTNAIGYVLFPKLHFSSREGRPINSRCRRFDLLLFAFLAQYNLALL